MFGYPNSYESQNRQSATEDNRRTAKTERSEAVSMEVSSEWAQLIFSGIKKLEMRKNNPTSWGQYGIGEVFNIIDKTSGETHSFQVTDVRKYSTFVDAVVAEGVRNLLPGKFSLEEAEHVYFGFDDPSGVETRRQEFAMAGAIVFELAPYEKISKPQCSNCTSNAIVPITNMVGDIGVKCMRCGTENFPSKWQFKYRREVPE
jgi:ASC-1-like (ASCH) protein